MQIISWIKKHTVDFGYYFVTILLTFIVLEFTVKLSSINWHIPLDYGRDTNFYLMYMKTLLKGEWLPFISNIKSSSLAAPFGLESADWPSADGLFFMIIKFIGFFIKDYIAVFNVYFISTFFLSSTLFVFAARQLNINYPIAVICGILFAFQPYHFARIMHIFLASYFMIPLMTVVLIWMWDAIPIFFTTSGKNIQISFKNYKALFATIVIVISAWAGIYYAFFFCFFVVVASLSSYFYNSKSYRHLISGGIIIGLTISSFILNFLPNFIYSIRHGFNNFGFERLPIQAEIYGLRIISLFMPSSDHRIGFLGVPMKEYTTYSHSEMLGSYLGLVAGLGLLFLIFRFIFVRKNADIYDPYSILSIAGILLSTVSGFGLIFSFLISPNIRAYSRMSIFLASFGLFAAALLIHNYTKHLKKWHAFLIVSAILIIGVLDQTTDFHPIDQDEFTSDSQFVHEIEKQAGMNGFIFQLPFTSFPEAIPIMDMKDYSHFKGYLHSDTLRWTYGAVKGRPEADWYESMAKLTTNELVNKLSVIDFSGIYIDRFAYADRAKSIEDDLAKILHIQPLVSKNERLSYFNIDSYKQNYNAKFSVSELTQLKNSYVLLPPLWTDGAYFNETDEKNNWRWCQKKCTMTFKNSYDYPQNITTKMLFSSIHAENSKLTIVTDSSKDEIIINNALTEFHKSFTIAPGKVYSIKFEAESESVIPLPDTRFLNFKIVNFEFKRS